MRQPEGFAEADAQTARPTLAAIVTTCDDAHYLPDAIASLLAQDPPFDEVIVVDDGSARDPSHALDPFENLRLICQPNLGLSAARNTGLEAVGSEFVVFLDADDRLLEGATRAASATFATNPEAGAVYGGFRRVDRQLVPVSSDEHHPMGNDPFFDLLHGNLIAMHATVTYRTAALREIGGFDTSLQSCEDYDVYLRLAQGYPIVSFDAIVAEYRQHTANMSRDRQAMRETVLAVHARYAPLPSDETLYAAWLEGQANWQRHYDADEQEMQVEGGFRQQAGRLKRRIARLLKRRWPPAPGKVRFGDFGSTRPLSADFGWDRGTPIDRYYVEAFLAKHAAGIQGRVLEIGDDGYSRQFGGERIVHQDVLHVETGDPNATITGDITQGVLPDAAFDCIIFTQTLHLIFDVEGAIRALHAALKPGGVLLLTVPGISQIDRGQWGDTWFWSFTAASIRRIVQPVFGNRWVSEVQGNVFAAICFLQGLATSEVDPAKLAPYDPAYPVIIGVRARKAEG